MEILVIRHGETSDNIKNICQGQTQGKLNKKGEEQAQLACKELENSPIDLVFTSDLKRAKDTCNIIFKNRHDITILEDKRLRERNLGEYQGKEFPADFNYNQNIIEGAESIDDMFVRVNSLITEIKNNHSNKTIAIVSHGITIKVITALLNNTNSIEGLKTVKNCSINRFKI